MSDSKNDEHGILGDAQNDEHGILNDTENDEHGILGFDLSCPICLYRYSEKERIPRTLNCGHTLCTHCIGNILYYSDSGSKCGECRTRIEKTIVTDLPINYSVLRIIASIATVNNKSYKFIECQNIIRNIDSLVKIFENKKKIISLRPGWMKFKTKRLNEAIEQLKINKKKLKISAGDISTVKSIVELTGNIAEKNNSLNDIKQQILLAKSRVYLDFLEEDFKPVLKDPESYLIEVKNKFSSLALINKRIFVFTAKHVCEKMLQTKKIIMHENIEDFRTGVFLQIETDGMKTFLEFELDEATQRAQMFSSLCLSDSKLGLKNSSFTDPARIRMEGENISFGKISRTKSDINLNISKIYGSHIRAGSLVGKAENFLFTIHLEGWPSKSGDNCFGKLTRGIKFLQNSVVNGQSIRIIESGQIFNFKKKIIPVSTFVNSDFTEPITPITIDDCAARKSE